MGPCIVKIRIDLGIGSESKVSLDADIERLEVICSAGETVKGREFQSLEVIGINELANPFVRFKVLNHR